MRLSFVLALTVLTGAVTIPLMAEEAPFEPVAFTDEFLNDPANIERGREIWGEQCKLCHGKTAYPGKGPRLKPYKYKPDFVYKRVTKGFRGMPAWAEVYDEYERMAVTAFIMSDAFSN